MLSVVTLIFALSMSGPLMVSYVLDDGALSAFGTGMAIAAAAGMTLRIVTRGRRRELQVRDGFLLVALGWSLLPAFGALPLMLYLDDLSFTDAYFESVSGLTTTGATVLSGLDELSTSINLWRCQLQWMGGMGILVLAVAILPLLGVGGSQIFRAETPGPMKDAKLTPRIAETAKGLWGIYAILTALCTLAYGLAGMDWVDAVMHAFTTLSLGGLSSHDASFGYWDSPAIELVAVVFMLVAGMNFATHFIAIRSGSLKTYARDPEVMPFLGVLAFSIIGISTFLWLSGTYDDPWLLVRHAAFNVVSIATTTGYASTDFGLWPIFVPLAMILLCSFTTSAGSTGAGIKMVRAVLMAKHAALEMKRIIHPRAVIPLKLGSNVVDNRVVHAVLAFMLVYGCSAMIMTMLLIGTGMDAITAFSAVMASLNNMGPGLNEVGPAGNFSPLSDFQTWVCAFAMLLGRLELLSLIVVLTPAFWRR